MKGEPGDIGPQGETGLQGMQGTLIHLSPHKNVIFCPSHASTENLEIMHIYETAYVTGFANRGLYVHPI